MGNSISHGNIRGGSGLSLPVSPQDCVNRLRSHDKSTKRATSFQIATKEYTQLRSVAQLGGTLELIQLFNSCDRNDNDIKLYLQAIREILLQVPEEISKLAANNIFMENMFLLFSKISVNSDSFGNDLLMISSLMATFLIVCDKTKMPIASVFPASFRIRLCDLISNNLIPQTSINVASGLVIIGAFCIGVSSQTQLYDMMQKVVSYLLELPFDDHLAHAHNLALGIIESCMAENTNTHEQGWVIVYTGSYFPKLLDVLTHHSKGLNLQIVMTMARIFVKAAIKYDTVTQDGKFLFAWAQLLVSQSQPTKDIRVMMCVLFYRHTDLSQLRTVFEILSNAFSLQQHKKQQKCIVGLCCILFGLAGTPANAQKLIEMINALETLYGTPLITNSKLEMISSLLVAVHCSKISVLSENEYHMYLSRLIPATTQVLQTICASVSPDIKVVRKLINIVCMAEEYLTVLYLLLRHPEPEVAVGGVRLLFTWANKTDWNVWSSIVVSSYLPVLAQKLSPPSSPTFTAIVFFLRYQISSLQQAQKLLPPFIHSALVQGCVALIPQHTELYAVLVDVLRFVALTDTTKKILPAHGALELIVDQLIQAATTQGFTTIMYHSLVRLFVAIDDEVFAAHPPWSIVLSYLFSVTPTDLVNCSSLLEVIHHFTSKSSFAQTLVQDAGALEHIFLLLRHRPIAAEHRFLLNILWHSGAWGHLTKQMLTDARLTVLADFLDSSQDSLLRSLAGFLWTINEVDGVLHFFARNHYSTISALIHQVHSTTTNTRFLCCGWLGKMVEKQLLQQSEEDEAIKLIKAVCATPTGNEILGVVFNRKEFQTTLGSWMTPNTNLVLQEFLLWVLVSFNGEKENIAADSLQSALINGSFLYALKITLSKKYPPRMQSLARQHISSVWRAVPTSPTSYTVVLQRKSSEVVKQPVNSEFAIEELSRVDAAHIKDLSSHPAESEVRKKEQVLIEKQYELVSEFDSLQSQVVAICLRNKSNPLASLVVSVSCKKEPSPSEFAQLLAVVGEWKQKFGAGRKFLVVSSQPFLVQSMLQHNTKMSRTLLLDAAEPIQHTGEIVPKTQKQIVTTNIHSMTLADDPDTMNPTANLQRCTICLAPLRGVAESSLKYADVASAQVMCPICEKSQEKITEAWQMQNSEKWVDAVEIWEALGKAYPNHAFFFAQIAVCNFKAQRYEAAHVAADRAIKMKDDDPTGHLWTIFFYSKLASGRIADAGRSILDAPSSAHISASMVDDICNQVKMVLTHELNFAKANTILPDLFEEVCNEFSYIINQ